ncbi:MAG: hypothetical protein JSW46_03360 [Gemmatimonadota bacterium]|nr:MAG: hypothetical protein JSW46_03360 [Gemmatimonadota bacterium]
MKQTVALGTVLLAAAWVLGSANTLRAQDGPAAQDQDAEIDPWAPLRLLEGTWEGVIDGRLGHGTGRRSYEFIHGGRYLVSRHASVRLPQDESPEGDYHRELAVYSYDRERGTIVSREFMVEGFVTTSTCETEPMRFVCTAEAIESGPGMQSRLTVEISNPYQFVEIFELAWPGEELQVYFTNTWTRVPDLQGPW